MADSGIRQILILQKLPRYPRLVSTQEIKTYLTEHDHDVSMRTIQRDLELLSSKFPVVNGADFGKEKGWAIDREFANQSLPVMEPTAALTMLMAMQHLQQLLPKEVMANLKPYEEEAKHTLKMLDNKKGYRSWQSKVRILPNTPLKAAGYNDNIIYQIYDALLTNKKIKATYKDKAEQIISPLGLIQRGNQFYLIATFFDFDDIRITALQRYSKVELTNQSVKATHFNIDEYIASGEMAWPWDDNKAINIELSATDWAANYLQEFPLSLQQTISQTKSGGNVIIKAPVIDTYELRWWLLSMGNTVKVEKPKALQKWVVSMLQKTLDSYNH